MGIEQVILEKMREATGRTADSPDEFVLLHAPCLPETSKSYVLDCIDTGWVSSAGAYVTRFEEKLAEIAGCQRAVAAVNGTAALEMCFRLVGVEPGNEVICPSLTFVATANAIRHCQATPHFVDVTLERLSICPAALRARLADVAVSKNGVLFNRETGCRIAALCLMHCLGHPGDIDAIKAICDDYGLALVEDAAESLGSYYRGRHTGTFGRVAAVSFNGNKIVTTGGGGAILTDDQDLADRAKHLTTTAKVPHPWEFNHDEVAWNYRLPNVNAAIGLSQLEIFPQILAAKRQLANRYASAFADVSGVEFLTEPADSQSNYWLHTLLLAPELATARDAILGFLNQSKFQSRPIWTPMHRLAMFADCPRGTLDATESIFARAINIPSSAFLVSDWDKIRV